MSSERPRPLRALIADADEASRMILEELLTAQGYDVLAVTDGPALAGAALVEQPDVIFLDLDLPQLDLGPTIELLQGDATAGQSQLVLMSPEPRLPELARALGADAVLAKPFDLDPS